MEAKKNPEIEIGRNSSLYFAIGLNLMLLFSWQMLEYKTYKKNDIAMDVLIVNEDIEEDIPTIHLSTSPPPPPPPAAAISESIQIVEDAVEVEETFIESTETGLDDAIADAVQVAVAVADVKVEAIEDDVEVPFAVIEDIPVFPGCEGLRKNETKNCFQQKIQEHIVKNFKYPEQALELGIQGRVSVLFVIDTNGYTTKIRSRGPDKILEKEAERIVSLLPKMKPGKQRGRPVKVAYAVPIFFKYMER